MYSETKNYVLPSNTSNKLQIFCWHYYILVKLSLIFYFHSTPRVSEIFSTIILSVPVRCTVSHHSSSHRNCPSQYGNVHIWTKTCGVLRYIAQRHTLLASFLLLKINSIIIYGYFKSYFEIKLCISEND